MANKFLYFQIRDKKSLTNKMKIQLQIVVRKIKYYPLQFLHCRLFFRVFTSNAVLKRNDERAKTKKGEKLGENLLAGKFDFGSFVNAKVV